MPESQQAAVTRRQTELFSVDLRGTSKALLPRHGGAFSFFKKGTISFAYQGSFWATGYSEIVLQSLPKYAPPPAPQPYSSSQPHGKVKPRPIHGCDYAQIVPFFLDYPTGRIMVSFPAIRRERTEGSAALCGFHPCNFIFLPRPAFLATQQAFSNPKRNAESQS